VRLANRVGLVTGSAQGLGQAFTLAMLAEGADVIGVDVAAQDDTAAAAAGAGPGRFLGVTADVTDPDQVGAAVAAGVDRFGGLHIVVNNAGIFPPIPFEATSLEDFRRILRVNVEGPFIVTQAALPALRRAGWGRIVNIASAVVFLGPPDLVAYTTSKAALVGFTRALSSALGPDDITVNCIAPGLVDTVTAARTTGADGGFERVVGLQVVPRRGHPADLVSTLLYVCDTASGFLTGQTINVDGGSAKH
jgi:NAD(P)-dependent dehydrogenase (short-subunit alcohol dehydrogenase family)